MFKGFVLRQCDIVVLEERLSTGNHFFNSKYDNIGVFDILLQDRGNID